jgi:hypothetical protein
MIEKDLRTVPWLKHALGLALSCAIGLLGGMICGATILSLCGLSGRSKTTGAEYIGYWNFGLVLVGAMYGGPLGAILGPLGYVAVVREVGFRSAMLPAAIGTIVGGFAGSLITPVLGVPAGILGFFGGLIYAKSAHSASSLK